MAETARPFDGLEPDVVLDAVEAFGVRCDGRLLALNSFENRVYQVGADDGSSVVVKFYRPDRWSDASILEEHGFSAELAEAEIPVVAPLTDAGGESLCRHAGFRYAVYPSVGGYWPELETAEDRTLLGRFVGRMHAIGAVRGFRHRPAIDADSYGARSIEFLLGSGMLPDGIDINYERAGSVLLERVREQYARVPELRSLRLHGDLHRGNILWSRTGISIVDLDDCRTGPAIQDLWMLTAGTDEEIRSQMADIISGYRMFHEFDMRELALIEALRALRMMHHAAWLARRWADPAFPAAFPWFNTPAYWENHLNDIREQIEKLENLAADVS